MLLANLKNPNRNLNENSIDVTSSVIEWINTCLKIIICYYFVLLFSMGVGVLYLIKDSRPILRKFPALLHKKANVLLYSHILITTINYISTLVYHNIEKYFFAKLSMTKIALLFLQILESILWVSWLSFTIYYYFVTKKSISKFPAFEKPGVSKNITKAFRNSLLIINLTFLSMIEGICIFLWSLWRTKSNYETLDNLIDDKKVGSIPQILMEEKSVLNFFSWSSTFFDEYIIIILLFWIWFNHDKNLSSKNKPIEGVKFKS